MNLSDINVVRDVMSRHGINFTKSLGQNFLINPNVCPDMADMSEIDENTGVLEIGAGVGVLTKELAERAKKVVCIEIDSGLLPVLGETLCEYDNIEIINQDVLKVDINALIKENFDGMRVVVCANLPYYITSPVLTHLMFSKAPIESITVMIQKEVATRLCTPVGSRASGAITVCTHFFSEPELLFNVSRGSFVPSPNVDSAVIKLNIKKTPDVNVTDQDKFFKIVKASFAQRRKTVVNSISSSLGIPKPAIAEILTAHDIDVNIRAEKISLAQFAILCEELEF